MNIQPIQPQVDLKHGRYTLARVKEMTGISANTIRKIRDNLYPLWKLEHAEDRHPYYTGAEVVAIWKRFW